MIDFWPDDVLLDATALPLCGTLGHVETEVAAAMLVLALASRGYGWVPVPFSELAATLEGSELRWLRNPFCRPDFGELIEKGYAIRPFDSSDWLELTPAAIERLRPERALT